MIRICHLDTVNEKINRILRFSSITHKFNEFWDSFHSIQPDLLVVGIPGLGSIDTGQVKYWHCSFLSRQRRVFRMIYLLDHPYISRNTLLFRDRKEWCQYFSGVNIVEPCDCPLYQELLMTDLFIISFCETCISFVFFFFFISVVPKSNYSGNHNKIYFAWGGS